jgi:exodeoxyribonuclease V alpha subunit
MLVRVVSVRVQNRHGAIFRAQRITDDGEIQDTHREVVARLHANAIGVKVMEGQWWRLRGEPSVKSFINAGGFQMTEEHLEVATEGATLELPDGAHIVDFLARNRRFEGVGRVTAQKLWEQFKDGLVGVLDQGDHEALTGVVTSAKARMVIEAWKLEGLSKTLQWLQSNGIELAIGRKIIGYYGAEAVDKIEENPYRLLSFAAGWIDVDRLATGSLGVGMEDGRRLAAAVEEVVYRRFSLGDTFVPYGLLVEGLRRILGNDRRANELIDEAIQAADLSRRLLFDLAGNAYSLGANILENRVIAAIAARLPIKSPPCDVDAIIAAYEDREGHGFRLNGEQRAAVDMVATRHFSVITGGAGCGKTTVLEAVCQVLEDQGYDIVQLALAGKAAKRMQESTGRPAMTLASFLSKLHDAEKSGTEPISSARAILLDEASMVDLISFSGLAHSIRREVKIVLIGDEHQLSPVGPGLILHCLTNECVPHVELKAPKRFGSEIAALANSVRDGELPLLPPTGSVRLIEMRDVEIPNKATELFLEAPEDTVILTTTRAMAARINQQVQARVSAKRREVRVWNDEYECYEATGLREQDIVICTRNHWDLGLQNGSIGRIVSLSSFVGDALGAIEWDDGKVLEFGSDMLDCLELAYALTVHKSQGSQWKRAIVCLPRGGRMVDRSLVYTAITRARFEVVILGSAASIGAAVRLKKAADRRHVGLPSRLAQLMPIVATAHI